MSKAKIIKKTRENKRSIVQTAIYFRRMKIIDESRQLHMPEVLRHPLGPLPSSLATSNGVSRKTNKAQLCREREKLVQTISEIPSPSVYVTAWPSFRS